MAASRTLLIVACSRRKRPVPGLLPALERYDGPIFRLLRRYQREHGLVSCDLRILSAEFGLLHPTQLIPCYDRQMDDTRARALRPIVLTALMADWQRGDYERLVICLGRTYRTALAGCGEVLPPGVQIETIRGAIGKQLATLYDRLYESAPAAPPSGPAGGRVSLRLRGIGFTTSREEALAMAREALAAGQGNPDAWYGWYVLLDERQVAPKWLVSCLSGLPVGAFTTGEARRVLAALGVKVQRA